MKHATAYVDSDVDDRRHVNEFSRSSTLGINDWSKFPLSHLEKITTLPNSYQDGPRLESPRTKFQYLELFKELIKLEEETRDKIIKERIENWGLERLKKDGYCLTDLHAYWAEGKPSHWTARFSIGPGIEIPYHRFTRNSQVYVSRKEPFESESEEKTIGIVKATSKTQIDVEFDKRFNLEGAWRLDLRETDIVYKRMKEALNKMCEGPEFPKPRLLAEEQLFRAIVLGHPIGYMQHATISCPGVFAEDDTIQSWARRYREIDPVVYEGDPVLPNLNTSQIRAMAVMIGERLSLIQGPPGTGKTKTIVETVRLLKVDFKVPHTLLVCTYTNSALDHLVEGFVERGLKPLRVGDPMQGGLKEYTLHYQFEIHPGKPEYDSLEQKKEQLESKLRRQLDSKRRKEQLESILEEGQLESEPRKEVESKLEKAKQEYSEHEIRDLRHREWMASSDLLTLRQAIISDIISRSDVVCVTCIKADDRDLKKIKFPLIFLDEASMAMEPASLVPIVKGCHHLTLIGDHKQLPPVVGSSEARQGGLVVSLFERLIQEGHIPSIMLDTQYRMHPDISAFSNREFYDSKLLNGTVEVGEVHASFAPPHCSYLAMQDDASQSSAITFIDHNLKEAVKLSGRVNWADVYIICRLVEDLLLKNPELTGADIGIIAPYKDQVSLIETYLKEGEKTRKQFAMTLGAKKRSEIDSIEVKTVDGFEGREKRVIILSTVRNNAAGHIGFLADPRRLNVALTRAKRALIIIGNLSTISKAGYGPKAAFGRLKITERLAVERGLDAWQSLALHIREKKLVKPLWGEQLMKTISPFIHANHHTEYFH